MTRKVKFKPVKAWAQYTRDGEFRTVVMRRSNALAGAKMRKSFFGEDLVVIPVRITAHAKKKGKANG